MILLVGTSGFSYDEWRGAFYPAEVAKSDMLAHYASQLPCVEINNTFYRTPQAALLEQWAASTPADFRFALKASRRITHIGRLRNVDDAVGHLATVSSALGDKRGVLLFQLPPNLRRDDALLRDFLALLPAGLAAALEFRHASWLDDAVFEALRERGVALVGGDDEGTGRPMPLVPTAELGYLRLRAPSYDERSLDCWRQRIEAQPWQRAFVFFKHETLGPSYALRLLGRSAASRGPGLVEVAPSKAPLRNARPGVASTRRHASAPPRKRARKG